MKQMIRLLPKHLFSCVRNSKHLLPLGLLLTFVDKRILLLVGSECSECRFQFSQTSLSQGLILQHIVDHVHDGAKFGKRLYAVSQRLPLRPGEAAYLSTEVHRVKICLRNHVLGYLLLCDWPDDSFGLGRQYFPSSLSYRPRSKAHISRQRVFNHGPCCALD